MLTGKYLGGAKPPGARLTLSERFARYNNEQAQKALAEYVALAKAHGLDPAQMANAWAATRRVVTSSIIGGTSVAQLKRSIDSLDLVLSPEVLAGIDAIHTRYPNPAP